MESAPAVCLEKEAESVAAPRPPDLGRAWKQRRILFYLHSVFWGALFFGLFLSDLPEVGRQTTIETAPLRPFDSLRSMNYYLGGQGVAQTLGQTISQMPKEKPVLIFVRGDALSIFHGVAIGYLAWPRPVKMVFADEQVAAERLAKINPETIGGVVFCKVEAPAWFPQGVVCGPYVHLVCLNDSGALE